MHVHIDTEYIFIANYNQVTIYNQLHLIDKTGWIVYYGYNDSHRK